MRSTQMIDEKPNSPLKAMREPPDVFAAYSIDGDTVRTGNC
jgi:hypothetical protein